MLGKIRHHTAVYRGDTIIEVLFAITIFSLIAVSAMTLMNRGLQTSQQSLELTAVRQEIDGQAEALRFLHGAYVAAYAPGSTYPGNALAARYDALRTLSATVTPADNFDSAAPCAVPASGKFVIDSVSAQIKTGATDISASPASYAQIVRNDATKAFVRSEGVWVQGVASPPSAANGNVGFVDFHIRACWDALNSPVPMRIGTIVRLYDPAV